jgi:ATP-dependent 26S proteasome regulatory subunit
MLDFSERLYSLLRSPYSFLQILSYEEDRIIRTVQALAETLGRPVHLWSPDETGVDGLLALLGGLADSPDGSIFILCDVHPYIGEPRVVRSLRQLEPAFSSSEKVAIFVSPFADIPRELIKDFTILNAPLPGRVELAATLEQVFSEQELEALPKERLIVAALGLTLREASRAFHRAKFEREFAAQRNQRLDLEGAIVQEKRRLIEFDQVLEFVDLEYAMEHVGGLDALKVWLAERRDAFSDQAHEFGLPTPKGLLLTGVQGCGKSLFAKAIAGYWGIPLLRLDIGRLFDGRVSPEAALAKAISIGEALSPAVLWCDEIEKGFGKESGAVGRMMGTLLTWLEEKKQPVFFVATANSVQDLPPELLRKGRFDEVFFVDLPDEADRADILRIHITRRKRDASHFDLALIAKQTNNYSGAELEQIVVAGLFKAFAKKRELEQIDLETAASETVPLYRTYEEVIKALRQWAETRARPAARSKKLIDLFHKKSGV